MDRASERDTPRAESSASDDQGSDDYINADDIFYWMEDRSGDEIPLGAIWIDIPTGCRFCC